MPNDDGSRRSIFSLASALQAGALLAWGVIWWRASNVHSGFASSSAHPLPQIAGCIALILLAELAAITRCHHALRSTNASSHIEATALLTATLAWRLLGHLVRGGTAPSRAAILEEWFHSNQTHPPTRMACRWDALLGLDLTGMLSSPKVEGIHADRNELRCAAFYSAADWILWTVGMTVMLTALGASHIGLMVLLLSAAISRLLGSLVPTLGGFGARELCLWVLVNDSPTSISAIATVGLILLTIHLLTATAGAWVDRTLRRKLLYQPAQPNRIQISVVIPVLNEEAALVECVRRARQIPEVAEVVIADGGSRDRTQEIAGELGCVVVNSPPGRGRQLRTGAERARFPVLLFLHADTWLPPNAGSAIQRCLADPRVAAGGLWKRFRDRPWLLIGSRPKCLIRVLIGRRIVGDMALFVRKETLDQIGGVPDMELMEDFALSARLRRIGRLALADATLTTSARRFVKHGVIPTYLKMWRVTWLYRLGTPPSELRKIYQTCTESDSKTRSTKAP